MKADKQDQQWKMRASREDKKIIRRLANRFRLTESGTVRFLIRTAEELTRDRPAEINSNKEQPATA